MQGGVHRATNLQGVLTGFDQECIDSTIQQTFNLRSVGIMHCRPVRLAQSQQAGTGANGPQDIPRTTRRNTCGAGDLCRLLV